MLRRYNTLDYSIVKTWAEKRNLQMLPKDFIPELGFIDPEHCVIYVYETNTKFCYLDCLMTNPDSDKQKRNQAIEEVFRAACNEAKARGFGMISATTHFNTVKTALTSSGFTPFVSNTTLFVRGL